MEIRTSVTHPIYVDWLPRDAPGKAGLTFAPGKTGSSNMGHYCWQRDLTTDLTRLRDVDDDLHSLRASGNNPRGLSVHLGPQPGLQWSAASLWDTQDGRFPWAE